MTEEEFNEIVDNIGDMNFVISYFINYYHPDKITIDNTIDSLQKLFDLANTFENSDIIDYIYHEDVRKLRVSMAVWSEGYLTGRQMDEFIDNLIKYKRKLIEITGKSLKDLKTSSDLT